MGGRGGARTERRMYRGRHAHMYVRVCEHGLQLVADVVAAEPDELGGQYRAVWGKGVSKKEKKERERERDAHSVHIRIHTWSGVTMRMYGKPDVMASLAAMAVLPVAEWPSSSTLRMGVFSLCFT